MSVAPAHQATLYARTPHTACYRARAWRSGICAQVLVLPWSLVKEMKELEYSGIVGYPIVLWMVISIMVECIKQGFPAIKDGSLPVAGFTSPSACGPCRLRAAGGHLQQWACHA